MSFKVFFVSVCCEFPVFSQKLQNQSFTCLNPDAILVNIICICVYIYLWVYIYIYVYIFISIKIHIHTYMQILSYQYWIWLHMNLNFLYYPSTMFCNFQYKDIKHLLLALFLIFAYFHWYHEWNCPFWTSISKFFVLN